MRLALYCPIYGFYETEKDKIGRQGEFYTSVSVGELFGQLLAFQFSELLGQYESDPEHQGRQDKFQIVEAGAHRGDLARDILQWLSEHRPEIFEQTEYCLVEPSERRRSWQARVLAGFEDRVRWVADLNELEGKGIRGIIFSNELFDSMAVHRVTWDAAQSRWFEWGVIKKEGGFEWAKMEPERSIEVKETGLGKLPAALLDVLPHGFTTEICPEAERWWKSAAQALHWGKLMTIDYGFSAEELLAPERKNGTLRAYRKHQVSTDLLANPGEQDLTAHVNFSALERAGHEAGLITDCFTSQSRFLTGILARMRSQQHIPTVWTSKLTRQFQTLTNPEHLGQSFRVLVQSRGGDRTADAVLRTAWD